MSGGITQRLLIVVGGRVGIAEAPASSAFPNFVLEFLSDGKVAQVVLDCHVEIPQKGVSVTQGITRLSLHCTISELLRQVEGFPAGTKHSTLVAMRSRIPSPTPTPSHQPDSHSSCLCFIYLIYKMEFPLSLLCTLNLQDAISYYFPWM